MSAEAVLAAGIHGDVAGRALTLCQEMRPVLHAQSAAIDDLLRTAREAVEIAAVARATSLRLAVYFARMAEANDREPTPGNGVYSGAAAFRHAAELALMLSRGEQIAGLGEPVASPETALVEVSR